MPLTPVCTSLTVKPYSEPPTGEVEALPRGEEAEAAVAAATM